MVTQPFYFIFMLGLKIEIALDGVPTFQISFSKKFLELSQRVIVPGTETVTTWLANQKQQDSSSHPFHCLKTESIWMISRLLPKSVRIVSSSTTCLIPSLGWLKYWLRMRAIVLGERNEGAETAEKIEFKFWISVCFKHSNREHFRIHTRTHQSTYNL